MHIHRLFHVFFVFLEFSRNHLAGDEPRQATHPNYMKFWVPTKEPPGGTSLTAKRCKPRNPVLGFPMNDLAIEIDPPGDANQFWFDFDVLDVLG